MAVNQGLFTAVSEMPNGPPTTTITPEKGQGLASSAIQPIYPSGLHPIAPSPIGRSSVPPSASLSSSMLRPSLDLDGVAAASYPDVLLADGGMGKKAIPGFVTKLYR